MGLMHSRVVMRENMGWVHTHSLSHTHTQSHTRTLTLSLSTSSHAEDIVALPYLERTVK